MTASIIFGILVCLVLAYLIGKRAEKLGRRFLVWSFCAMIITPLLAWILLEYSGKRNEGEKDLSPIFAISIVLFIPVFFLLLFKPLSKVPRPKAPQKMFATGVREITNDKGDKVPDSTYH